MVSCIVRLVEVLYIEYGCRTSVHGGHCKGGQRRHLFSILLISLQILCITVTAPYNFEKTVVDSFCSTTVSFYMSHLARAVSIVFIIYVIEPAGYLLKACNLLSWWCDKKWCNGIKFCEKIPMLHEEPDLFTTPSARHKDCYNLCRELIWR